MNQIKMKPGTYYIGDPSYIIRGNDGYYWIEKLWNLFYKTNSKNAFLEIDNVPLFIGSTYGGDGVYDGIYVDSGTICVMQIDHLHDDPRFNFRDMNIKGTRFMTFSEEFFVLYDEGIFKIGDLDINTQF